MGSEAQLRTIDPLETGVTRERVHYATGVLLDAGDFRDEQTYHRGRLARALACLHGHGTIAGLRVQAPEPDDPDQRLTVHPGVALDRHGRLIEVPRAACIRLARWFDDQSADDLAAATHAPPEAGPDDAVLADVFLRFVACERAKTPAFAAGPFDALDAVVPARVADAYELALVLRMEAGAPPLPANLWPDPATVADPAAGPSARLEAVLGGWRDGTEQRDPAGELVPLAEHVAGQDTSSVFLARIAIPVDPAGPGSDRPQRRAGVAARADNTARPLIFLPGKWLGGLAAGT